MKGRAAVLRWIACAVVVGLLALCSPSASRAQAIGGVEQSPGLSSKSSGLPPILKGVNYQQRLGVQIPLDDLFQDENGNTVRLGSYFGKKPVVLILAYYRCPMLCSLVLHGATTAFKQMKFQLGDQFDVLTVSFDPTDSPAASRSTKETYLNQYGRPGAAQAWHFLTGQKAQIDRLTDAVGFHYAYNPQNGQYAHAAGLVVLTPAGKVAQYFYGVEFEPQSLRLALVQSSQEKIGSLIDQIVLYCCTYDPNTGKYHAIISRVLQVAGILTILVIGSGILFLYWFTSKRKHSGMQPV